MLGFPEYMSALDDELHNKFLGVFLDSTGGMLDRQDPHQSVDPYIDQESYDKAYDAFIDALEERYNAISASMSGGRMAQLQRWRSSLDLPLRTEEELCVSALASNNKAAFIALQCESRVSFQNLCETHSDLVSNYDEHLCASLNPASTNLAVIIPVLVIGMLVLSGAVLYIYSKIKQREADRVWQIDERELIFKDPAEVIGKIWLAISLLRPRPLLSVYSLNSSHQQ